MPSLGDEEVSETWPQGSVTLLRIMDQRLLSRAMDRHQPGFAEFGSDNHQDTLGEIDVSDFQVEHFTQAQARHGQQSKQGVMR